jgi:hypothetical protein
MLRSGSASAKLSAAPNGPRATIPMRILVVSDIHANWHALKAIDQPFDVCLCLGDLVD